MSDNYDGFRERSTPRPRTFLLLPSSVCGRTEEPVVLSQLHLFERQRHRDAVAVPHGPGAGRCVFTGAVEEKTVLSQLQSVEKICSRSECRAMSNKGSAPVDLGTLRRYHGLCDWKAPYESERSGRNVIPCSGWARSFTGGTCGFADDRNASAIPSSGSVLVCGQ